MRNFFKKLFRRDTFKFNTNQPVYLKGNKLQFHSMQRNKLRFDILEGNLLEQFRQIEIHVPNNVSIKTEYIGLTHVK